MAPRFYPWSKHGRRSNESMRTGGPTPTASDESIDSEDMELQRNRPPPLRLIMPKDTKDLSCLTPSSIVIHDSGLGSATYLALAANEAMAAVNKLLGSPTKDNSAGSELNESTIISELPASFVPLKYPPELPAELPGSLLMQYEGFSPDSLIRWGRGPEKFPRAVAISLTSESPATPSRKRSRDYLESPDSSNAGSGSIKSNYSSATEGNASAFKSALSSSSWLKNGLLAGVDESTLGGLVEGKTEQLNQVLTRLVQAHEATLRDRDDSITSLTSQVHTLQVAHNTAVASLQNNHAAEIEFLRSLISQFEKSKISHEPCQHLETPEADDIRNSVLDTSSRSVNARLNETAEKMASDVIAHRISSEEPGQFLDSEHELREQVQAFQIQEDDLSLKIARLEAKVADGQDDLLYYKRYTAELHTTLDTKNDKILDLEMDIMNAKSEITQLREENGALSEFQRQTIADAPKLETMASQNEELRSAMVTKAFDIHDLRREATRKDDEIATLGRKLAGSENVVKRLHNRLIATPNDITPEAQLGALQLYPMTKEDQDYRMFNQDIAISDLECDLRRKEKEITTLKDRLAEYGTQFGTLQQEVEKLQNQVITKPVDITLSYSAQASPNAGLPSAVSDSSGLNSVAQLSDKYKDPFKGSDPIGDPFVRIKELEHEVRLFLDDIRLYKLDVRGYKKDVKGYKKEIEFRDNKITELKKKIEELNDAFIGLNFAYSWGGERAPTPPPKTSVTTPQQGSNQSSPVGLGIDGLQPRPLRTRPKASPQSSPGQVTPVSKFNASFDPGPVTPPSQTAVDFAYGGSTIKKARKSHTPKMPSIEEQRDG
ncbi:MAG: hypothetical protein M1812_000334 [Candelaria pacifica]|nr:MAG: hypothetical protein M1812_000334 [Candelaria pacifica]